MVVTHVRRTPWGRTVELIMAISPGSKGNRAEEPIGRGETKMAKADARVWQENLVAREGNDLQVYISITQMCEGNPGRERRGISYPRWTMEPPNQSIESNRQERESGHGEKAPPARAHFPDSFLFLCGESRLPRARKVRNQI